MNGYSNAFYIMGLVATISVPLAVCLQRVTTRGR